MKLLLAVGALLSLPVVALCVLSLVARTIRPAGLVQGRLADCPRSPNCVSSEAVDDRHRVEPLRYAGSAEEARSRLLEILGRLPRTRVVTQSEHYVHAEAQSRWFRFIDDIEFLIDPAAGLIHVRSAARVGYSDAGVNRERVERIRQEFEQP
jgi:uncharacterized protein (DUF1499 family)